MSTLYIRLPSHLAAEGLQPGVPLYCQYAVTGNAGAVERDGVAALPDMAEHVKKAQRVVLLLAASDVTLLRVKMPPLSGAKLRAALPNLVEDQLMSDPAECVVVAGEMHAGVRTVAVVSRTWMELLNRTMVALGARRVVAVPSQLCLPHQADAATAAVSEHGTDIELAVRLSEQEGLGLSVVADQPESAAFEAMQSLAAVVPTGAIVLYVPQTRERDYQESLHIAPALQERITLQADSWQRWTGNAERTGLDLMSGLGAAAGPQFNWRPWRWPLVLGTLLLLINVIGLNVDWLRMKREAEALRNGMTQTYRNTFPKDPVIVDPLAQLRQKLAGAQRESGQLAPDDFLALAAAFNEAWAGTGQGKPPVGGLEYREGTLTVKLKPGSQVTTEQLAGALSSRNLAVTQPKPEIWEIRSAK
ncbi:MAG TPA: type II secretion system protein GspL [Noviherbaspirillum sp.]|uniref:type II secretion system protein GspL n=1 Tax=Noviherbaspirillum sp. TaxID=1926288 RepID=UPI002D740FF2|nr:type II secretion system protein GspL [Noviherbaspirillum sp.]HYD96442.1 type II secretion system protein GspL [Noviherbaspirillum sp.]